jgi:hypothetical protein
VFAQAPPAPRDPAPAARKKQAPPEGQLPVSLDRIRRELGAQTRTRESRHGLRLDYYVEVYGTAPRLQLFAPEFNFTNAPVMYGGMTHEEFLSVVTPEEFRSPPADISGAIAAFVKWAIEKKKSSSPRR